jgi:hypothetical protein
MQNAFGQQGLRAAFGGPTAAGLGSEVTQRGLGLLDSAAPTSFNDLAAQRLTALRDQARPGEQRAVDAKFNNLFASGRLGTEGGARGIQALADSQNQADLGRQINSLDFAQGQSNQERAFAAQQQQLGASLVGQGFQGIGMDQARAMGLGNMGANIFGMQGQTEAARLGAFQTADQSAISRGQRRLGEAQAMFGFGDALTQTGLDRSAQQLGMSQSMDQALLDQARLGASVGQAQSTAGANAGALAMKGANGGVGTALAGFGTGLSNMSTEQRSGVNDFFGGLFGGGGG